MKIFTTRMKAVISDVHGNLEALQAVLAHIAAAGIDEIYCLGDIVGFGPNPCECIDLITDCSVTLLGNHDEAATASRPDHDGEPAARWTHSQLRLPSPDHPDSERRLSFLAELPRTHRESDFLFVHGGPLDPVNQYLFPEDVYHQQKMESVFQSVDRYCFMGHTHIPGVFTDDLSFHSPVEIASVWQLTSQKTLVNVGSVGQPRDGDRRACYVQLDGTSVRFCRVDYDFETTVRKISRTGW